MAYTEERLLQAQRLFDRSAHQFSMLPSLAGPYHLRERASKQGAVLASWHDNDKDEDYEPPGKRTPGKRKATIFHGIDRDPRPNKRARSFSPGRPSSSRLSPESEVDSLDPQLTPSHHSEPDSWDRYWAVDPKTVNHDSGYSLRRRTKETIPSLSQESSDTKAESVIQEVSVDVPTDAEEAPLRQCSGCQDLGLECSLLSNPDQFAYPCTTCAQDGLSCIVSPAPEWKRTCESCKGRRREVCSYRYVNYDHTQPCQLCVNHGFECVAGPARNPPFEFCMTESSEPSTPTTSDSQSAPSPSQGTPEPTDAEGQKSSHPSSPLEIDTLKEFALPHEVVEFCSVENQKHSPAFSPLDISTPTATRSVCGPAQASTSEESNANEASSPTKISIPSCITTEPLGHHDVQTSNSTTIHSFECSNIPSNTANPPSTTQTVPDEVIVIDSDDEIPNEKDEPIYISDSPRAPQTSLPSPNNAQSEKVYRMWTSLVHPVEFLADVPQDGSRPCHWCNNFAYGIVGLGDRHPEIFEYSDGTKIELVDGHSGENKEQSRMCTPCTWDRVKILRCSHYRFTRLRSTSSEEDSAQRAIALAELEQARQALIDPDTGKTGPCFPSSNYKWCGLCRNPAFISCQTLQPVNAYADVVDCDEETYGCGLMLCKVCYTLSQLLDRDLLAVTTWNRNYDLIVRADVEYLLPGAENNTLYKMYMET